MTAKAVSAWLDAPCCTSIPSLASLASDPASLVPDLVSSVPGLASLPNEEAEDPFWEQSVLHPALHSWKPVTDVTDGLQPVYTEHVKRVQIEIHSSQTEPIL